MLTPISPLHLVKSIYQKVLLNSQHAKGMSTAKRVQMYVTHVKRVIVFREGKTVGGGRGRQIDMI